jgi:hypothetical protein
VGHGSLLQADRANGQIHIYSIHQIRILQSFTRCEETFKTSGPSDQEIHDPCPQEKFTVVKEFAISQNRKAAVPIKSFRRVILGMEF